MKAYLPRCQVQILPLRPPLSSEKFTEIISDFNDSMILRPYIDSHWQIKGSSDVVLWDQYSRLAIMRNLFHLSSCDFDPEFRLVIWSTSPHGKDRDGSEKKRREKKKEELKMDALVSRLTDTLVINKCRVVGSYSYLHFDGNYLLYI